MINKSYSSISSSTFSVNVATDSLYSKVKRHQYALTSMNAAMRMFATKMPIASMNWAATVADVDMVSTEMASFASELLIALISRLKLNPQRRPNSHRLKRVQRLKHSPQKFHTPVLQPKSL